MNDHGEHAGAHHTGAGPDLERMSDTELQNVSDKAAALLREREKKKREAAIAQINEIAKAHGLIVTVKDPQRKRGRPPKKKAGS